MKNNEFLFLFSLTVLPEGQSLLTSCFGPKSTKRYFPIEVLKITIRTKNEKICILALVSLRQYCYPSLYC